MIESMNPLVPFNPVNCLAFVRQHRILAVQTRRQFVFALLVVVEHYKEKIDKMDPDAYGRFMKSMDDLDLVLSLFEDDESAEK